MQKNQFDFPDRKKLLEIHKQVLKEVRAMTKEEGFKSLIKSGIYTPDGQLAPEYGGSAAQKIKNETKK